jgi:hypothetical protein
MTGLSNRMPPKRKVEGGSKRLTKQRAERLRLTQQAVNHVQRLIAKEDVPALVAWEIIWHGVYWELQRRRSIYVNTGKWDLESARLWKGPRK